MDWSITPLFLLPLVAGFNFIKEWERLRYLVPREDGHKFYFRSAFWGLVVTIITAIMVATLSHLANRYLPLDRLPNYLHALLTTPKGWLLVSLMLCPIVAYPYAWLLNRCTDDLLHFHKALKDNEFEALLVRATIENMTVMVTMEDGKVYVGWVFETSDPSKRERKYFSIIPLMSGYRNNDGSVAFTTYYEKVYDKAEKQLRHLSMEHFTIVLPVARLASARMFDPVAYNMFQQQAETTDNG